MIIIKNEVNMKKHFDIWRNKYNSYLALFSYSDKKTTEILGYEYLDTIVSKSPKKAIDDFYQMCRKTPF